MIPAPVLGTSWRRSNLENEADEDRTFWTDPYIFFTSGELGITASRRIRNPDGKLTVLAFDVLLNDISELTAGLDTSPNGFALVTDMAGRLVGLPRDTRLDEADEQKAAYLKRPTEIDLPVLGAAAASFRKHFRLKDGEGFNLERGLSPDNVPFRWRYGGEAWWTAIKPCQIGRGPQLWIAITVPEDDFLAELKAGRIYSMLLAAGALAIAALVSMHLARRYSRPIQSLIEQSDRLTTLNTEKIEAGRSRSARSRCCTTRRRTCAWLSTRSPNTSPARWCENCWPRARRRSSVVATRR